MVLRLVSIFALCLLTVFSFDGCSPDAGNLLSFRDCPASFTARFPSSADGNGEVVCEAVLRDGEVFLTITAPERSAGIAVTCSAVGCTVEAGGMEIPMSDEAAAFLRDFVLVLTEETEGDVPTRSSDGGSTVLGFPDGVLTLDENLLPCAVSCEGMNGAERRIIIENYTIVKDDSADTGSADVSE